MIDRKTWLLFMFSVALLLPGLLLAGDKSLFAEKYMDMATGHTYVKVIDSYKEYSKTGVFLKMVPYSLPLLKTRMSVIPLEQKHFIEYTKQKQSLLLPALADHPDDGWKAIRVFTALKTNTF